jgi:hypothetical protein
LASHNLPAPVGFCNTLFPALFGWGSPGLSWKNLAGGVLF